LHHGGKRFQAIVSPGHDSPHAVEADGTTTGSGIVFDIPASTTFAELKALSTHFLFIAGTCTAGSPRFQSGEIAVCGGAHLASRRQCASGK
jgi:hypothetical protein